MRGFASELSRNGVVEEKALDGIVDVERASERLLYGGELRLKRDEERLL